MNAPEKFAELLLLPSWHFPASRKTAIARASASHQGLQAKSAGRREGVSKFHILIQKR